MPAHVNGGGGGGGGVRGSGLDANMVIQKIDDEHEEDGGDNNYGQAVVDGMTMK